MVWARGENGEVPYGQKGVDDGCKQKAGTGQIEVRLDGVKVALGGRGMTVEAARKMAIYK